MRAATIEFGKGEDGVQIILLSRPAKIAFGANEVTRQPVAGEPHEASSVEALRIVRFRGSLEIGACRLLIFRAPLSRQENRRDRDRGPRMPLCSRSLIPVRRGRRIGWRA